MADKRCVIDTNVLIYSTVEGNPWYDEARQWLTDIQNASITLPEKNRHDAHLTSFK